MYDLRNLPISEYIKNYYTEHGIVLSDFACASVIWHSTLPWGEVIKRLLEIAESTTDTALKEQIRERVEYERREMRIFMDNADGKYVYRVTQYDDGSGQCVFSTLERALEFGRKYCETKHIQVEKVIIDPEEDEETESDCCWDKNGEIIYFYSRTGKDSPEWDMKRFEDAFIPFVFPFERGDIVRDIEDGFVGVLATSRADWEDRIEKVAAGKLRGDDRAEVSVDYVEEDGNFYYAHRYLLTLEKISKCATEEETDILSCISRIDQGREMLTNLFYYRDRYVESLQRKQEKA